MSQGKGQGPRALPPGPHAHPCSAHSLLPTREALAEGLRRRLLFSADGNAWPGTRRRGLRAPPATEAPPLLSPLAPAVPAALTSIPLAAV